MTARGGGAGEEEGAAGEGEGLQGGLDGERKLNSHTSTLLNRGLGLLLPGLVPRLSDVPLECAGKAFMWQYCSMSGEGQNCKCCNFLK